MDSTDIFKFGKKDFAGNMMQEMKDEEEFNENQYHLRLSKSLSAQYRQKNEVLIWFIGTNRY